MLENTELPPLLLEMSLIGFGVWFLSEPLSAAKLTKGLGLVESSGRTWIKPGLSPAPPLNLIVDPGTELFPAVMPERSLFPPPEMKPFDWACAAAEAALPLEANEDDGPLFKRQHICELTSQNCS